MRLIAFLFLCFVLMTPIQASAEARKVIAPAEAAAFAGEKVTVEFMVEASSLLSDRESPICFLNSMKNFRSQDNFTVVIFSEGLVKFQRAKIEDPAEHFREKTIQVTGEVGLRQGKAQIVVEYPGQIEIVEKKSP